MSESYGLCEKTLKRAELFLGLDDIHLSKIAALPSCREERYQPEDVIFKVGDMAKNLYVVKQGRVDLVMKIPSKPKQSTTQVLFGRITTGGFFGWSALVGPHSRTMSAVCKKPSTVVSINADELITLLDKDYYIGYKVFQILSHIIGVRMRLMEQVLLGEQRWPFLEVQKGP